MKYFIGGEIESDVYDRFRIQRNKILDFLKPIEEIKTSSINEISFTVYVLKKTKIAPITKYIKKSMRLELEIPIDYNIFLKNTDDDNFKLIKKSIIDVMVKYENKNIEKDSLHVIYSKIKELLE
ncbi:Imm44 family immunity protein [Flavobacterium sp. 140616W15]|uniref:Imm44 family immunity protein n=1 Tax=Flavobacterium sp. 140616W15 TaxID=2478552 RepID=UPI000F0C605B|nr:Imm44 family immunity protein [Flavobacterium sp. 140616W15]AYN04396.1 hypothetical protein EAG11_09535 [Flavobacterium sp. 140616W15]